jgi:hypothetical protein
VVFGMNAPVHLDFLDLQQKAVNYITDHPARYTPRMQSLILGRTPYIRYGSYRLKLKYVIPNINIKTSEYQWEFFNKITDNEN